jgi:rhodanese-related sulfurtransferase
VDLDFFLREAILRRRGTKIASYDTSGKREKRLRRMKPRLAVYAVIVILVAAGLAVGADDFPLRKKYPQTQPITTKELAKARALGEAIVIDVRTKGEYDVMHIKGAMNISHIVSDEQQKAFQSAAEKPHQYMVFYCNGVTCSKSYKAADLAMTMLHLTGVRNYDAGILDWAETYPEETIFFGEPMTAANAKEKIIPESDFKRVLVDTATFIDMARSGKYEVYDIRDKREKSEYPIDLPDKKEATIDDLQQLLQEGKLPKSNVLLLDNVGRQVIWAQYYLNRFGVKDYFFLAGGVEQWRADGKNQRGDDLGKVFGRPTQKKK